MKRTFTLVEVVVAMGILMSIMGLAGFAFVVAQKTWTTISMQDERLKQLQMIDMVLDNAVRNAVPFYWTDCNNKEVMLFAGTQESLYLTYLHRIDNRELGGIRFLRLSTTDGKLIAEYRQTPILSKTDLDKDNIIYETLAEGVKQIQFRYVDLRDERLAWYDDWDVERMRNIPVGISLTVEFLDGKSETWFRRSAGAGQSQQLGNRLAPM